MKFCIGGVIFSVLVKPWYEFFGNLKLVISMHTEMVDFVDLVMYGTAQSKLDTRTQQTHIRFSNVHSEARVLLACL